MPLPRQRRGRAGRWPVPAGRDLQVALEAADRLSEADLLRLYEAIADRLDDEATTEVGIEAQLREKAAALRALMEIYDRLELDPIERLPARTFNEECHAIGSGWNSTRVARAWGRWRVAIDVIGGTKPSDRLGQRATLLIAGYRRTGRRDARVSLYEWLGTGPEHRSSHAYDAWAAEQNKNLPPKELPYLSASGIANALITTFATAVREAQRVLDGDTPPTETDRLQSETLEVGEHKLVTWSGVALLLGCSKNHVKNLRKEFGFPPVVATVGQRSLWRATDIERYRDGKVVLSKPDELAEIVLSPAEVAARVGMDPSGLHKAIKHQRASVPQPDGYIDSTPWWDAQRFEQWMKQRSVAPVQPSEHLEA
jgi:predicted DNA-binding transcriptional regulator AlpA